MNRIVKLALIFASLLLAIPLTLQAEELLPEDILPEIVSVMDMPEGYDTQRKMIVGRDSGYARITFSNVTPELAANITVAITRWSNTERAFGWYDYLLNESDVVVTPNLGIGEKSIHTAIPDIRDNDLNQFRSQTVTVIWQEWLISTEIAHYWRYIPHQGWEQDFTDREAGDMLRELNRVVFSRFLGVLQAGSSDDFTSDMAGMESEGVDDGRGSSEWCKQAQANMVPGTMRAPYIGVIVAATGNVEVDPCVQGIQGAAGRGTLIKLGDCIRTGSDGLVRIQLADRDEERNAGPSIINIATKSDACFDEFLRNFDANLRDTTPGDSLQSSITLMKGAIRTLFKGWGKNSSISVKTGVTVCGIRGSDVLVTYDPDTETTNMYVLTGHGDMTNRLTGEVQLLTAGQQMVSVNGVFGPVEPLSQSQWDRVIAETGTERDDTLVFPPAGAERIELADPASIARPTSEISNPTITTEPPVVPQAQPRTPPQGAQQYLGSVVMLQSKNYPSLFIRHKNLQGEITKITSAADDLDASFRMVPGLADPGLVSFESVNYPKHFLRHFNFRIILSPLEGSDLFRNDATFRMVPGLADTNMVSFESRNYPGRYIRHRNFHLFLDPAPGDPIPELFMNDTTFRILPLPE